MKKIKLKLNNKEIGFHFGLGFLGEVNDALDFPFQELDNEMKKNFFKVIPVLMFEAHKYDCMRANKDCEYNLHSFIDLIDDDGGAVSEGVATFIEAFTKSMTKDVPKEPNKIPQKGKQKANLQRK